MGIFFTSEQVPFDTEKYRELNEQEFQRNFTPGTYCNLGMLTVYMPLYERAPSGILKRVGKITSRYFGNSHNLK